MANTFIWGGRSWGAGDQAAFAAWLKKHGSTLGGWAANHPDAAKILGNPGGNSAQSLYDQALALAKQSEQPEIMQITSDRQAAQDQAKSEAEAQRVFGEAMAKIMTGFAPEVSAGYRGAAQDVAGFGKGFSDVGVASADAARSSMDNYLTNVAHAPDAQVASADKTAGGGPELGDVEYGTWGYLPATQIEREGQGFTNEAAGLPSYYGGLTLQSIQDILANAMKTDKGFSDQLAAANAKIPGSATSILNDLINQQQNQESIDTQRAYLTNTLRNTDASITGVDPVTGQPTAVQQRAAASRQAAATRAAQAQATAQAKQTRAAIKSRESAFSQTRQKLFTDVKGMVKPMTLDQQVQWVAQHPGSTLADAPKSFKPSYVQAKQSLFNQYKDLLRFATRSGRPALRKRLNQMIDEALASVGIMPAAPVANPATQTNDYSAKPLP